MPQSPHALTALREMARALSAAWDLNTTLDLIANKTTEVMHADSCSIYLLEKDGMWLRLQASTGLAKRAVGRATLRVGEGMTGYAVQRNQPVYATEAQHDPHFKWVQGTDETPFNSLLAVPLAIESEVIGAMNVQTRKSYHFDDADVEMLSLIGDLAAGALAKAKLYDTQRQQIAEMQAVAQVSEVITSPQYLDDMLDVVTEMAAQVMDTAVCSIFLLDESGQFLEMRSAKRNNHAYQYRPPLPIGDGVIGQVVLTGTPTYIPDVRVDPCYKGSELAEQEGLVSLLSVPLSVRDRVIGVLNAYSKAPRIFTAEQHALLTTLANQTALAIENARLVMNTAVVREMHHRIKNNLQTVAMLMQLQIPDAERLDTREVLETNIHRIRSIAAVHETLSVRGFRLVDLKDVLQRITRATAETMIRPSQNIRIQVHGDDIQLTSRAATALALVVNELVQNSLEHAFSGRTEGRIEVSLGHSTEEWIVVVKDNGNGLPDDYQSGLGMELATTLVNDDLNGRLRIYSSELGGTETSIRIPINNSNS